MDASSKTFTLTSFSLGPCCLPPLRCPRGLTFCDKPEKQVCRERTWGETGFGKLLSGHAISTSTGLSPTSATVVAARVSMRRVEGNDIDAPLRVSSRRGPRACYVLDAGVWRSLVGGLRSCLAVGRGPRWGEQTGSRNAVGG